MVIPFVLVIGILGVSVMMALYSSFMPYFSLLTDIQQYNKAYYGANTAIERSLLGLRYHDAGFEGESGWIGGEGGDSFGASSDAFGGVGFFGSFDNSSNLWWEIDSRVTGTTFPRANDKQIPVEFKSNNNNDRGILSYNQILKIPLRVDDSDVRSAYSGVSNDDIKNYHINSIGSGPEFVFVLNDVIKHALDGEELDENSFNTDQGGFPDEIAINRDWSGRYKSDNTYSILPRALVGFQNENPDNPIVTSYDENIRMSDINKMSNQSKFSVHFSNSINPLNGSTADLRADNSTGHLLVGGDGLFNTKSFNDILEGAGSATTKNELTFSLQNILKAANGKGIYPFVQWKMKLDGGSLRPSIAKPYFNIIGSSKVGKYDVSIQLQQALDTSYLGSFTVVF